MIDFSTLAVALATIIAAAVGAYLSARFGQRSAETETRRNRRHALAAAAIDSARLLRNAIQKSDPDWTGRDWERVIGDVYDALNAAAPVLPRRLLHLRRSIRDACGEALGAVAVFELVEIRDHVEPTDFDPVWSENARDYVDVAIQALRHWRESTERDASSVWAPNYDEWLRSEGRYSPGF